MEHFHEPEYQIGKAYEQEGVFDASQAHSVRIDGGKKCHAVGYRVDRLQHGRLSEPIAAPGCD